MLSSNEQLATEAKMAVNNAAYIKNFIKNAFNDATIDATDTFKYFENAISKFNKKLADKLQEKNVESVKLVAPKVAIPLLESAVLEEDDDLYIRWVNMFANAMNANYEGEITRNYISMLIEMNKIIIQMLDTIANKFNDDRRIRPYFHDLCNRLSMVKE